MPAATLISREQASLSIDEYMYPKRRDSSTLPSSLDVSFQTSADTNASSLSPSIHLNPILHNRAAGTVASPIESKEIPSHEIRQPLLPGSAYTPSTTFDRDFSTRHLDVTDEVRHPVDALRNRLFPRRKFSPSDNVKFIATCCMWYISSSLTNNTGKQILNVFKFPVTLTFVQFGVVAMWCYAAATLFKVTQIRRPTREIGRTIVPLAVFLIVGHVFSSIAISRVPVSMVHTIKALSPLFTVLFYRFIFGVRYDKLVYISLLPLTFGVILACSITFSNNFVGLICAFLSCLVFVSQNIFSKKILFKEAIMGERNPNKLDKMNVLFYSSLISFVLMTPLWLYMDGSSLRNATDADIQVGLGRLTMYILINGTTNFGQNWFAFTTLSLVSPVTYSIASLVKRIFVIVMSIVWFGQHVSLVQSLGIMLTFVGLYMYQTAKRSVERSETKVREKSLEILPTASSFESGDRGGQQLLASLQSWVTKWRSGGQPREDKIL